LKALTQTLGGIAQVWVGPSPERIWELDSKVAALLGSADRLQRKVAGYREAEQRSFTPPSKTSTGVAGLSSFAVSSSPDNAGMMPLPVATAPSVEMPPLSFERGLSFFPGGAKAAAAAPSGGCSGTGYTPVGAVGEMEDGAEAAEQIDIAAHQAQLLRAAQHAQLDGQVRACGIMTYRSITLLAKGGTLLDLGPGRLFGGPGLSLSPQRHQKTVAEKLWRGAATQL